MSAAIAVIAYALGVATALIVACIYVVWEIRGPRPQRLPSARLLLRRGAANRRRHQV